MKTITGKTLTTIAVAVGFALGAWAADLSPTVFTVTQVTATAGTNFNGSAVTVGYSAYAKGGYETVEVKVSVGGHDYYYDASGLQTGGGSFTVQVANDYAQAGNVVAAVISVTGKSGDDECVAYRGTKYLYQGHASAVATNAWFDVAAARLATDGAWDPKNPPTESGKIIFEEDDDGVDADYTFTPNAPASAGQVVVVESQLSFDAALDDVTNDMTSVQAAYRVVTTGDDAYRFAAWVGGQWATNTSFAAALNTDYTLRLTLDYRTVPYGITYEVKQGSGAYAEIANGTLSAGAATLASVEFVGSGALTRMVGSNCVASVDARLVKDGDNTKYATIDAVPVAKRGNLTLLWNTAWVPAATTDGAWTISGGGYQLYVNPTEEGVWVKNDNGTWTVYANYFEAANLAFDATTVTTNKYTYFTNAVAQTGVSITNIYLLHDVTLGEALTVNKTMTFNGEANILSGKGLAVADGKTFTVAGGCIGITQDSCTGDVKLEGGRYKDTPGWTAPTDYEFVTLATPVRDAYTKQLMLSEIAPDDGEKLLPITDANGEAVSVVVSNDWAQAVTGQTEPAQQAAALSVKQANGLTLLDNAILGLTNGVGQAVEGNIPVIKPVQSAAAGKVTFSLGNVNFQAITNSGARVSYRVYSSTTQGGKDGDVAEQTDPADTVEIALPASGVKYYIIEVDNGAVK